MNAAHILVIAVAIWAAVDCHPAEPQSIETIFRPLGMKLREARTKAMVKIMRNTQIIIKKLCAEQTSANADELARIKAGDFEEASNATKCYIHCFVSGMGIMKDGVFQFAEMQEAVGTLMTPEMAARARTAIATCKEPEGEDNCEKAFNLAKCFKTADKEIADSLFYPPKTDE